ncbi:hypothetical protein J4232_02275 [Candidatus Woesearchaeota archaeon]|nr:hypothetical protein [Candidatus Woesearchaeota archaeon]
MLHISTILKHYKHIDIQQTMLENAIDREVAVRFNDYFGKRPDVLQYPNDILEFAKQGATSFHVSEEQWNNPLHLNPNLSKKDIDELRKGWDLVLDIDCKLWDYSKLITHLLIQEIKAHGITAVSCKFSGNKGFHIGIPFEAFPQSFQGKVTKQLFPEGPRRIALYLKAKIEPKLLDYITTNNKTAEIAELLQKPEQELFKMFCNNCSTHVKQKNTVTTFVCEYCDIQTKNETEDFLQCEKCKRLMKRLQKIETKVQCSRCSSASLSKRFDIAALLDIDTVLISSRHLYRMAFSLHEKSGLFSLPIDPEKVLEFNKEDATPQNIQNIIKIKHQFLNKKDVKKDEARELILQAFDFHPIFEEEDILKKLEQKEFSAPENAIPEELFPPCMLTGLNGMEDGKKRFMFALINFLESVGWDYPQIEELLTEWNKKNPASLREVIIGGQLRYRKEQKKKILPQSCRQYYEDLQLCHPDNLCQKIKNPVQYATRKAFILNIRKEYEEKDKVKKETKKNSKCILKKIIFYDLETLCSFQYSKS